MYAIKALYDGTGFQPMQPIPVKEKYDVVITFIEPAKNETTKKNAAIPGKLPRSSIKGALKGKVWLSSDFNEPIDVMREYME